MHEEHPTRRVGLRATGYGLRATGYGLRATGYGLRYSLASADLVAVDSQ